MIQSSIHGLSFRKYLCYTAPFGSLKVTGVRFKADSAPMAGNVKFKKRQKQSSEFTSFDIHLLGTWYFLAQIKPRKGG